jgi:TDG/mug DNA glycosylase family protein
MSAYDPNILVPGLDVVFCGLNPGASAVRSGHSFSNPSNRFWPVLHLAGFTPVRLRPEEERRLLDYGCGITAVVERATVRADEVPLEEFRRAGPTFERKIRAFRPRCVAFLGKRAIAAIGGKADILWGRQPEPFADAMAWVLPNPSGLNRAFTMPMLIEAYAALRATLDDPPGDRRSPPT